MVQLRQFLLTTKQQFTKSHDNVGYHHLYKALKISALLCCLYPIALPAQRQIFFKHKDIPGKHTMTILENVACICFLVVVVVAVAAAAAITKYYRLGA